MANKISSKDGRITIYAGKEKDNIAAECARDPRFTNMSGYCIHLIALGRKADADARKKAIESS